MTPQQLIKKIRALPERAPHTEALEKLLLKKPTWYVSQKEHWLGWLSEYGTSGAYGRIGRDYDAAFAYNHCGCPPMVLWLGEASRVDGYLVARAARLARQNTSTFSAKCAGIRKVISWETVERFL
ncbi:conserved hypothetical protein [Hyphomicrobium sp. GJ21]|uniref:hypothetical protein n=1 Tax=Hyphomicrobium sp. GJ21 TaxID=113574 RepID=UPI000622C13C|nr:hypothetical protein [Hyphomicrobium sp. GJ21]CEJ86867.1 conserved hypothetical protein [Hyphomicrobium sp. GJ21]